MQQLFERWYTDRDADALARAQQIGDAAIATMRATGLSEAELGGELSGMLSRTGFLKSFSDDLLDPAREALTEALTIGDADMWATNWNLANIAIRQGNASAAVQHLDLVAGAIADHEGKAFVLVYVPGRPTADSLVMITEAGIGDLLDLQRAVVVAAEGGEVDMTQIVDRCRASDDPAAAQAAIWVAEAFLGPTLVAAGPTAPT